MDFGKFASGMIRAFNYPSERTANSDGGSKDTSDFKRFKTLIKSLKVLLPFYFLFSQPLFCPPSPFSFRLPSSSSPLAALRCVSARFRHQKKKKS